MTFDEAFFRLLGNEGGYVNNSADPGGETNWGISKRSYPNIDIKNLTQEGAKAIYLRDFWAAAGCDTLPDAINFDVFDMAVNSGVRTAIKTLQDAVKASPDGVIGPLTLQAIKDANPAQLTARFNGARLLFMAGLPTWPSFGRGWARRIANNLLGV